VWAGELLPVHMVNEVQIPAVLCVDLVLTAELDDFAIHVCQLEEHTGRQTRHLSSSSTGLSHRERAALTLF
jgi:hypothetical protein